MFSETILSQILSISMIVLGIIMAFSIVGFVIETFVRDHGEPSRWLIMIVVCAIMCASCTMATSLIKDSVNQNEQGTSQNKTEITQQEDSPTEDNFKAKPLDGFGIFDYN